MTEREAVEIINDPDNFADGLEDYSKINAARFAAMWALREAEQYRAIGTVEECKIHKYVYDRIYGGNKNCEN